MAKIVHSEAAPAEAVHYALAGVEFDLEGDAVFETDDREVIRNAEGHPWLHVDEDVQPVAADGEALVDEPAPQPVAIEAGLVQTEAVVRDGVAETLAADETAETPPADAPDTSEGTS